MRVELKTCKRCGHQWLPRQHGKPRQCAKCHSTLWDVERRPVTSKSFALGIAKGLNTGE